MALSVSGLALAAALAVPAQPPCAAPAPCIELAAAAEQQAASRAPLDPGQADPAATAPVAADAADQPASVDQPPVIVLPEPDAAEGVEESDPTIEADTTVADPTIVVTGGAPAGDPAQEVNAATFEVVQQIDESVVAPIAKAYDKGVPSPIRKGLRNFLRNLGEPINFLNFMLQLKPVRAFKTLGRFAINSTIGIAGLFNPASKKPFNLKYDPNGLSNTLGFYGVGPGPYLYLPFIGSTTVRDLFGRFVDLSIIPAIAGKPFNQPVYAVTAGALNSLESRILVDGQIAAIREECGDTYSATRDIYLIGRQSEIDALRGKPSTQLGTLVERLKGNCDIAKIRAASEGVLAKELEEAEAAAVPMDTDVSADTALAAPATEPVPSQPIETIDPTPAQAANPDATGDEAPVPANDADDAAPLAAAG